MKTADAGPGLATVADYRATPEGGRYQLINGEIVMAPSPSRYHQEIVVNLVLLLETHVRSQGMGRIFAAPFDVHLGEHDVLQPDLVFVSSEQRAILADDGAHGGPALVVEVISPSSAHLDKTYKREVYAAAGVGEYWLIDPHLRQIHVYEFARDRAKPVRLVDEDETFESPSLPGLAISAAAVFRQ